MTYNDSRVTEEEELETDMLQKLDHDFVYCKYIWSLYLFLEC